MKIWNTAPLIRLLLPFLTGIFTAVSISCSTQIVLLVIFLFVMLTGIFTFTPVLSRNYRFTWLYGLAINLLLFLVGYQLTILKTEYFSAAHYSNYLHQHVFIHARIASPPVEKEKTVKAIVECMGMDDGGKQLPVVGKVLVYFQKDANALKLNYGDELIFKNRLNGIPPPQNPGEFDYRTFLRHKNIVHQAYLRTGDWTACGENSGSLLLACSLKLRNKLLLIFKNANLKNDEFAVASALLLGYTDKLDNELLSAYSETGTLHVLSVSGLHVAIVFVVFNTLLFFLDKWKYGRFVKVTLLLFFLWFYALLSGLSPSVLRSATMFSFIVYARSFRRNTTIYNTLAASAIVLLLCNPYLVLDVGFQLSYLAVAGIVYFQPFFSKFIQTEWWLLRQIGELISVSISAQLATFPISIYYFHQFPNYFLVSNLLVIPLSTCIMYLGLLLIAISANGWLLNCLSLLFSKMLALLNAIVAVISKWPGALTDFMFINFPGLLMLYALLLSCFFFISSKNPRFFKHGLYLIILLLLLQITMHWQHQHQKKMIIYAVPKHRIINFISGREHLIMGDTAAFGSDQAWIIRLKPYWSTLGLAYPQRVTWPVKTNYICAENDCIQFYDHRLMLVCNAEKITNWYKNRKKCKVEYVILSENADVCISEVITVCAPRCVIVDTSNSRKKMEQWKADCYRLQQPFYSVEDQGAFILE